MRPVKSILLSRKYRLQLTSSIIRRLTTFLLSLFNNDLGMHRNELIGSWLVLADFQVILEVLNVVEDPGRDLIIGYQIPHRVSDGNVRWIKLLFFPARSRLSKRLCPHGNNLRKKAIQDSQQWIDIGMAQSNRVLCVDGSYICLHHVDVWVPQSSGSLLLPWQVISFWILPFVWVGSGRTGRAESTSKTPETEDKGNSKWHHLSVYLHYMLSTTT